MKIVIVAGGTMIGPFGNITDLDLWLDSHTLPSGGEQVKIFSMWDDVVKPATADTAHSCGVLLGRERPLQNMVPSERREALVTAARAVHSR